jgi:hypothetical protein
MGANPPRLAPLLVSVALNLIGLPYADRMALIDSDKLEAWISMNTVQKGNPSPGAAFIYVDDLMNGLIAHTAADSDVQVLEDLFRGRASEEGDGGLHL